jgi:Arc/MetJ family transcription regulator
MRPDHQTVLETEIELTAQELLTPVDEVIEIDDIVAAETYENAGAANTDEAHNDALQETSEIELTPEQMDAMLEGKWP